MSKDRLPWFRFWVQDFIQDEKVQRMNNEAVGLYVKLLILQWIEGSIPVDCVDLASLRLLETLSHGETHSEGFCHPYAPGQALLNEVQELCFIPHPTLPGRLINPRLDRERLEISKQIEAKREAGRKGGLSKTHHQAEPKHSLSTTQAPLKHSSSNQSQSQSQSQKQKKETLKSVSAPHLEDRTSHGLEPMTGLPDLIRKLSQEKP